MQKGKIIILAMVLLPALSGCFFAGSNAEPTSNKNSGAESADIKSEDYNCALIHIDEDYRCTWEENRGKCRLSNISGHEEECKTFEDAALISGALNCYSLFLITDYTVYPNGLISVTTKDGVKFLSSPENIILIYDETMP